MRVNFTDVQSGNFDPIPAGWYNAKVTDGEIKQSGPNAKNPGADYINWEFTIQDGDYAGRKQWYITSLLPQALFSLKDLLAATGKYDVEGELDFEIDDVVGSDVQIKVTVEKYNDDDTNKVKRVRAAGQPVGAGASSSNLP